MQTYVDKLKSAISDQIKAIEKAIISEISKYIKIDTSAITGFGL